MARRLEGKVIAVAGGCGTIGTGVSRRLAQEGAQVVLGDIDLAAAERLASEIRAAGGRAAPVRLDIADEASIAAFVQAALDQFGGLDGFHANAVALPVDDHDDVLSTTVGAYDRIMHANSRGYFLCTRHALPPLIARGGGCLLYTSAGAAYSAAPLRAVYAMAKSGVNALMRHVASRYGAQGVRSNAIAPGYIISPERRAALDPAVFRERAAASKLKQIGGPEDIAAMAALLLSDDGKFITGQVISVDGGTSHRP
jgi:NAD(P)-dependent dehydrogenase (short-subunit alcohol dehydrogenase family)